MDIRHGWNRASRHFESLRIRYENMGRITHLEKPQPSVPRHPIHRQIYLAPTVLGKVAEEIVHMTGAGDSQRVKYELLCRRVDMHHGVEPPRLN